MTKTPALETIAGIGPARQRQLRKMGITSVEELAVASSEAVARALAGVTTAGAKQWILAARDLASSPGPRPGTPDASQSALADGGEASTPLVIDAQRSSEHIRAGHLIGGHPVTPEFHVVAEAPNGQQAIHFDSTATAHCLGGPGWERLGRVSGSLRAGMPTVVQFPETVLPPGIYRIELDFQLAVPV